MENLDKLDLQEIKTLCKKYGVGVVGDKKTLIKKLKYFLDPIQDVLNTHTGRKLPKEKEIVGVSATSTEKINSVLKKKGQFLYYSLGYQYYLVDKSDK
jgi:Cys-tRNA synthase (O-phospho-L-seryl-tRNA:Cys-tRNA synthase)